MVNGNTEFDKNELLIITEKGIKTNKGRVIMHKLINGITHIKSEVYALDIENLKLVKIWDNERKFRCEGYGREYFDLGGCKHKVVKGIEYTPVKLSRVIKHIEDSNVTDMYAETTDGKATLIVEDGVMELRNYSEGSYFRLGFVINTYVKSEILKNVVVYLEDKGQLVVLENIKLKEVLKKYGKNNKVYYYDKLKLTRIH